MEIKLKNKVRIPIYHEKTKMKIGYLLMEKEDWFKKLMEIL